MKKLKIDFRKIKTKIIVFMLLLAFVPTWVVYVVGAEFSKSTIEETTKTTITSITETSSNSIDNLLASYTSQALLLSKSINFTDYHSDDAYKNLARLMIRDLQESNHQFDSVFFASEKGDFIIAPSINMPDGFDAKKREWYINAVETPGTPSISKPFIDSVTKELTLSVSNAVVKNNEVIGVIGINIPFKTFSTITNDIHFANTGEVIITDSEGTILADHNKKNIGKKFEHVNLLKADSDEAIYYEREGEEYYSAFYKNKVLGWNFIGQMEEAELTDSINDTRSISFFLVLIFVVISLIISISFSRKMGKSIEIIKEGFKKAAKGDLTVRLQVKTQDEFGEIGRDFNEMVSSLDQSFKHVNASTNVVLVTSATLAVMTEETSQSIEQVAKAIEEITEGTMHQAENTQLSAKKVEELAENLDEIKQAANSMSAATDISISLSHKGLEQIQLLTKKSEETTNASSQITGIVYEVSNQMKDINKMVNTISTITDQTNLLALNASIEAARAGEYGHGFAVVADEVRNLAEVSKASTREIKRVIGKIEQVVEEAVAVTDETKYIIEDQEVSVKETEHIFTDILAAINKMAVIMENVQVAVSASEESKETAIEAIGSISVVAEQNAAASEEVSASSEEIAATMREYANYSAELKILAEELKSELQKFKV